MIINLSKSSSFQVSHPVVGNHETLSARNETPHETFNETPSLLALSTKVLAKHQCNHRGNFHETPEFPWQSTIESIRGKQLREKLREILERVGSYYGANKLDIEEEMAFLIESHPLESSVALYGELDQKIKRWKKLRLGEKNEV